MFQSKTRDEERNKQSQDVETVKKVNKKTGQVEPTESFQGGPNK